MDTRADTSSLTTDGGKSTDRLVDIKLDQKSLASANANIEHEREVAIFDLLDGNSFAVAGRDDGPYHLLIGIVEDRLDLVIKPANAGEADPAQREPIQFQLGLVPLKRIMKDYFMTCESYYAAVRSAPPAKIQAIDVSRRAMHDEGSVLLRERLAPEIVVDADTARRLFTLVCSLHWKG